MVLPRSVACCRKPLGPLVLDSHYSSLSGSGNLDPVIEIEGVTKWYGNVPALDDVSVRFEPGVTGLLGPNGSGKSTLIKSLLGLVRTQYGSGTTLGLSWPKQVRKFRDLVGYLPEDDCYIAGLSGIESIAFMARMSGLPGTEALRRAHEIADFCDIAEERYRAVETYSTGMRQKLKFAQALVHDPPLLILDEPTTGLDPDQREAMLSRIRTLARAHNKSVVLSTHILPDVQAVCDHVIMLVRGQVRIVDTLENLSRPAEPTLHVSVHGDQKRFIDRLEQLRHTVSIDPDGTIRIGNIDDVATIWKLAAETETSIRQLEPSIHSLDKIFFEATIGGQQHAGA
jgi:ABC-2 type transport system ATP-binding protein